MCRACTCNFSQNMKEKRQNEGGTRILSTPLSPKIYPILSQEADSALMKPLNGSDQASVSASQPLSYATPFSPLFSKRQIFILFYFYFYFIFILFWGGWGGLFKDGESGTRQVQIEREIGRGRGGGTFGWRWSASVVLWLGCGGWLPSPPLLL